jgi:hypothetical protein
MKSSFWEFFDFYSVEAIENWDWGIRIGPNPQISSFYKNLRFVFILHPIIIFRRQI